MSLVTNKRYVQIAFNRNLAQVHKVLRQIPRDPRIIIEAGTPFIKREGTNGIRVIRRMWKGIIVADLKVTDGARDEVAFAAAAGANAVTAMGSAPLPTLEKFINACRQHRMYSMLDMLGVQNPLKTIMPLKNPPNGIVIHKGRDEESHATAIIRYKDISKVRSKYDVFISVAGGIVPDHVRTAFFNGGDIAILNVVESSDPNQGIPANSNISLIMRKILQEVGK